MTNQKKDMDPDDVDADAAFMDVDDNDEVVGVPPAVAAAAAAHPRGGDSDDEDDDDPSNHHHNNAIPGWNALLEALRDIARLGGYDPNHAVNARKVRIVLEAVGGDLNTAATLYWDDFLATAGAHGAGAPPPQPQPDQQPDPQQPEEERGRRARDAHRPRARAAAAAAPGGGGGGAALEDDNEGGAGAIGLVVDDGTPVARRLDESFARHGDSADDDDDPGDGSERTRGRRGGVRRGAAGLRSRSHPPSRPQPALRRGAALSRSSAAAEDGAAPRQPRGRSLPAALRMAAENAADPPSPAEHDDSGDSDAALPPAPRARLPPRPPPVPPPAPVVAAGRRLPDHHQLNPNLRRADDAADGVRLAFHAGALVAERPAGVGPFFGRRHAVDQLQRLFDVGGHRVRLGGAAAGAAAAVPRYRNRVLEGVRAVRGEEEEGEEASASVSDDEAGGVRAALRRRTHPETLEPPPPGGSSAAQHKRPRTDASKDNDSGLHDDEDPMAETGPPTPVPFRPSEPEPNEPDPATCFLSDDDWIWNGLDHSSPAEGTRTVSTQSAACVPTTDVLWGGHPASVTGNDPDTAANRNVIVDDPADDANNATSAGKKSGIPRTWLSAGFSCSECVTGLAVKPPSADDVAYLAWRQSHQNQSPRGAPPPPYHCRSVTAVLSIVTAAMYTGGATVLTDLVTKASSRTPLVELDPVQRKREWDSRLADALSDLLWIAVQASRTRKANALKAMVPTTAAHDENELRRWLPVQNRLELVPTCHWEADPGTGEVRLDEATGRLPLRTTLTNWRDVRCYVLSHLKAFTSSGGVALFLETILKIHGHTAVRQMMEHQQKQQQPPPRPTVQDQRPFPSPTEASGPPQGDASSSSPSPPTVETSSLIRCSCEEHYAKELRRPRTEGTTSAAASMAAAADSMPFGTPCISVELVSLLLTGRVHSTWHGWDTGPLDFGILTSPRVTPAMHFPRVGPSLVGKGLSRPKQPVWILRGPTCYSTLWMTRCHDNASTFAFRDVPGAVAHFAHWNAWYGPKHSNRTTFRLSVGRNTDPTPSHEHPPPLVAMDEDCHSAVDEDRKLPASSRSTTTTRAPSRSVKLLLERRQDRNRNARERRGPEPLHPSLVSFDVTALERVVIHPQDRTLYPDRHTLWRYDLGVDEAAAAVKATATVDDDDDDDHKVPAQRWTPYHRLSDRQKLLVEASLGPSLKVILYTRWPPTTVLDRFEPVDPPPIV